MRFYLDQYPKLAAAFAISEHPTVVALRDRAFSHYSPRAGWEATRGVRDTFVGKVHPEKSQELQAIIELAIEMRTPKPVYRLTEFGQVIHVIHKKPPQKTPVYEDWLMMQLDKLTLEAFVDSFLK